MPPGHAKHWSKFCGRYDACGRPVYFVNDSWYNDTYAPRYREYHERGDDGRRYEHDDHGDRRDNRDDDRRGNNGGRQDAVAMAMGVIERARIIDV